MPLINLTLLAPTTINPLLIYLKPVFCFSKTLIAIMGLDDSYSRLVKLAKKQVV